MASQREAIPQLLMARLLLVLLQLLHFRAEVTGERQLRQAELTKPRIANGMPASCGRFPYMVSLRDRENVHRCGGVLIQPEWILTAAHCVDPKVEMSVGRSPIAVIGACNLDDLENENGIVEVLPPQRTIIHGGWNGNVADGNDIALLKLGTISEHTPIVLPMSGEELQPGRHLSLGWGEQESSSTREQKQLQQATSIDVIRNPVCNAVGDATWNGIIKSSMLCAFSFNGEEICTGDSGGPLLEIFAPEGNISAGNPRLDLVVGVTSFGEDTECGTSTKPNVFTRIASFRAWIDKNVNMPSLSEAPASVQTSAPPPLRQAPLESPADTPMPVDAHSSPIEPSASPPSPVASPDPPMPSLPEAPAQVQTPAPSPLQQAPLESPTVLPIPVDLLHLDDPRSLIEPSASPPSPVASPDPPSPSTSTEEQAELDESLWNASRDGNTDAVRQALLSGADIETKMGNNEDTPIIIAAFGGHLDVVEILLLANAKIEAADRQGATGLFWASAEGYLKVLETLLEAGANVDRADDFGLTPLARASSEGHSEIVKSLLGAGANVNKADDSEWTPLARASIEGHSEIVKSLLGAGANVDKATIDEFTPLAIASEEGHSEIVKDLLNAGADPNKATIDEFTPLARASNEGHSEIVKSLLDAGADPNRETIFEDIPLHRACLTLGNSSEEIAEDLLDAGSELEKKDDEGITPLMNAARYGNLGVLKVLLDRGGNPDARNNKGDSVADLICYCEMLEGRDDKVQCPEGGCDVLETENLIREILP